MPELVIEGLSSGGEGVGRHSDGRVVFVAGALPGERVRVRFGAARKRVLYADLVEVVEASAARRGCGCDVEACGGCPLQHCALQAQAELKRQRVGAALLRLGHCDVRDVLAPAVAGGQDWHYRHRVRLHAAWSGTGWTIGYHQRRSWQVVEFSHCPVLQSELALATQRLVQVLQKLPRRAGWREVEVAFSRCDGRAAALLHSSASLAAVGDVAGWLAEAGLAGVEVRAADGRVRCGELELRYDHALAGSFALHYEPGLFTQASPAGNDALVAAVLQAVAPGAALRVLELHAGIGNFSLPLARAGALVQAVESHPRAAAFCRSNAARAGCSVEVAAVPAEAAVAGPLPYDVVLLDPPRTGARAVCEILAQRGPRRVVYVSCDPATLARDVAFLRAGGYAISLVQTFDMYAQTPHVESMVVLEAGAGRVPWAG